MLLFYVIHHKTQRVSIPAWVQECKTELFLCSQWSHQHHSQQQGHHLETEEQ